jgi:hypothetical protein
MPNILNVNLYSASTLAWLRLRDCQERLKVHTGSYTLKIYIKIYGGGRVALERCGPFEDKIEVRHRT